MYILRRVASLSLQNLRFKVSIQKLSSSSKSVFTSNRNSIMTCENIKGDWSLKFPASEVSKRTEELIRSCREKYNSIAKIPDEEVTCQNFLKVFGDIENEYLTKRSNLDRLYHIATNAELRSASSEAEKKFQDFDVEVSMREDIFKKMLVLQKQRDTFEPEEKRFLEKEILSGKRNGLHLSESIQREIKEIKMEIGKLGVQFQTNVNEVSSTFYFTKEELNGVPEDFFEDRKKEDETGKYEVTLKYPDYIPIMEYCRVPETRKIMKLAFSTQCVKENAPIMDKLIVLRHKLATTLGYSKYSEYVTEELMSKSAQNVETFLSELREKLLPLWEKEKKEYLKLKEQECSDFGIPFDGVLKDYDLAFYSSKNKKANYAVDENKLKEYFPLSVVTKGIQEIYQELLSLKFEEVKNPAVWHEDVQLFKVEDAQTSELLGYFYLDFFPRDGKYSHAANIDLQPGCVLKDGSKQVNVVLVACNFSKPSKDKPSLLTFQEVNTYFHEFGHTMHFICSRQKFSRFMAFSAERDFIEAPSQMLENWCYEPEAIRRLSSHYLDNSDIPDDLLKALINSKLANKGYSNLRQIWYATADFKLHSGGQCDTQKLFNDLLTELFGIEALEGSHTVCTFQHLVDGYDSQYYGYLWSEVYSMDMFETRFRGKIFDPVVGMEYRKKILEHGARKDAMDMLKDFLGRSPNNTAFLKSKGL